MMVMSVMLVVTGSWVVIVVVVVLLVVMIIVDCDVSGDGNDDTEGDGR